MAHRDVLLADSPIAYWRLEESSGTFADEIASFPGDATGTITRGVAGLLAEGGSCVDFPGASGDRIDIPDFSIGAGLTEITVELICQADALGAGEGFGTALDTRITIGEPIRFRMQTTAGTLERAQAGALTVGTTHHVICRYDGTNIQMFVDGVSIHSASKPGRTLSTTTGTATIGQSVDGRIDEVAIYNYALSDTRIQAHYNSSIATSSDTTPPAVPTGLTGKGGDTVLNLEWDDNTESDFDRYNVYIGGGYLGYSPNSYANLTGAASGGDYYVSISAQDTTGNESAQTSAIFVREGSHVINMRGMV